MSDKIYPDNWDEEYYLHANPDVLSAVKSGAIRTGYDHFMQYGSMENRSHRLIDQSDSPLDWSVNDYVVANPDLREFLQEPNPSSALFTHWNRIGKLENRPRARDKVASLAKDKYSLPRKVIDEMFIQGQFDPNVFPEEYFSTEIAVTNLDWMMYKGEMLQVLLQKLNEQQSKESELESEVDKLSPKGTARTKKHVKQVKNRDLDSKSVSTFTHVFLAPWLKTGGADKAAILFANTVASQENSKVLFITTEITDSPWARKLDNRITYLDFGNLFGIPNEIPVSLNFFEQRDLLVAYLLDNKPDVIHVINSHLGWYLLGKYGKALSQFSRLFTSLYCYDYTIENEPVGYARYIRQVAPCLTGIFTDNTVFPVHMASYFGVPREMFTTTWHPVDLAPNIRPFSFSAQSRNVLWASRLDRQKRVDILLEVAKNCPDLMFHVYGDFVISDTSGHSLLKLISGQMNVIYHGGFNSLNEIKRIDYRAFLYTSQWDGLPNILLEIGLLGLPIIAPLIGGIEDLLDHSTGYSVSQCESIMEYVVALRAISAQAEDAICKVEAMSKRISTRHNENVFVDSLRNTTGYLK